jgi:hypothetical protein
MLDAPMSFFDRMVKVYISFIHEVRVTLGFGRLPSRSGRPPGRFVRFCSAPGSLGGSP